MILFLTIVLSTRNAGMRNTYVGFLSVAPNAEKTRNPYNYQIILQLGAKHSHDYIFLWIGFATSKIRKSKSHKIVGCIGNLKRKRA